MGKSTIAEEGTRGAFTIYYNDIRSINFFLTDALEDDTYGDKSRATKSIPGHQRRRGPSDATPINVKQSTADYLVDPTLKSGNALPGISFILKTTKNADVEATRQFTLKGRSLDFIEYFDGKMKYETYIYLSNGGRHTLKPTAAQGG